MSNSPKQIPAWLIAVQSLLLAFCLRADAVVQTASGPVQGVEAGDVRVFKGIPYAAPPVGALRWKAPQASAAWTAPLPCQEFGPSCPQLASAVGGDVGKQSEDCLYLNVWSYAKSADAKLPVMVWIHGGGHVQGSGSQRIYEGTNLAKKGVIVVAINYRLGPFGYFSHPLLSKESSDGVSGNYGLMDQIAALQWVKKNIAAFGGDPDCVTVFGESAGSVSIAKLMVCPQAAGLFQRAICQSGGPVGQNRRLREKSGQLEAAEVQGESIAKAAGVADGDVLAKLRALPAGDLLKAANPTVVGKGEKFGPVVDGHFIPDNPAKLWHEGKQHNVPLMVGSNADDGGIFSVALPIKQTAGYEMLVRTLFADGAPELLKEFPAATDAELPLTLRKFMTVMSFVMPARLMAEGHAAAGHPVWVYHFTRVIPTERGKRTGAFHGVEIMYAFANVPPRLPEPDQTLAAQMSDSWAQFARTGNPNMSGGNDWPAFNADSEPYYEFGEATGAKSKLYTEACRIMEAQALKRSQ